MEKVLIASNNLGKIAEIRAILAPHDMEATPQKAFGVGEVEETGATFLENALIKARFAAAHTGLAAIADDSGLEVDALGDAPGVYSARYAGPNATDLENNQKLLKALAGIPIPARRGRFRCVMVYVRSHEDPQPLVAEGVWEGLLLEAPRGGAGFGYDPLFWIPSLGMSAAELPMAFKNRLSHRGQALQNLAALLKGMH